MKSVILLCLQLAESSLAAGRICKTNPFEIARHRVHFRRRSFFLQNFAPPEASATLRDRLLGHLGSPLLCGQSHRVGARCPWRQEQPEKCRRPCCGATFASRMAWTVPSCPGLQRWAMVRPNLPHHTPPHAIAVYGSQRPSPLTTQGGRCPSHILCDIGNGARTPDRLAGLTDNTGDRGRTA
jgi:hypothetical protein